MATKKVISKKASVKKTAPKKSATEPSQKATAGTAKKAAPKKTAQKASGFAVIETGGKQYKISEGDTISIEKLAGNHKEGGKVVFDKVLLLDNGKETKVGTPYISGAKVEAEFVEEGKGKKLYINRFRSKSRYRRRIGHRQPFSKVAISKI